MQVTKNDRVELESYQLKDVAHIWYTQWEEYKSTDAFPITWDYFRETFSEMFFPNRVEIRNGLGIHELNAR